MPASVDFLPTPQGPSTDDVFDEALFQRNQSAFLAQLIRVKGSTAARRLGMSETAFSEWKNKEAVDAIRKFTGCGMLLIDPNHKTFDVDEVQAYQTLARKYILAVPDAESLGGEV
jgi:hypothetical protein